MHALYDGSIFMGKGKVKQGVLQDGSGTIYYTNGSSFQGKIHRGKRHGLGMFEQSDHYQYSGQWFNDTFHGKGIWKTTSPTENKIQRYDGDFKNGFMTGSAVISYSNGITYRGEVVNSFRSGHGTLTKGVDVMYNGYWANGEYHGQGKRTYENGEYYEGYFKNGKRHGRGTYGSAHSVLAMDAEWVDDIPRGFYSGDLPTAKIVMDDEEHRYAPKIRECVICLEKEPEIVYMPCLHMCVCGDCQEQTMCPMCRTEIQKTIVPIQS